MIDVAKGSVQSTWSLAPCVEPTGLALNAARHRLFSVCHNERLIVTDTTNGARVAELPIGKHVDAAAYDPALSLVFSSNGDSADVTVVSEDSGGRYVREGQSRHREGRENHGAGRRDPSNLRSGDGCGRLRNSGGSASIVARGTAQRACGPIDHE